MMHIIMNYGFSQDELPVKQWDFAFWGQEIDQRGVDGISALTKNTHVCKKVVYIATECSLLIDDRDKIGVDDIEEYLEKMNISKESKVILECTTLGFAEILVLMQAFKNLECTILDALYLEPKHYGKISDSRLNERNYNLTTSFEGFLAIPGQALAFEQGDRALALCGYEAERVSRAFDEIDLQGQNCQLVFGVPPYVIGWDMNSYISHLSVIDSNNISTEFYYCGASNPLSVYQRIEKIYRGLDEEQKLFILPFGTKPMSLGACAFIVTHNEENKLSVLFDHPQKRHERSKEVGKWNLYSFSYD